MLCSKLNVRTSQPRCISYTNMQLMMIIRVSSYFSQIDPMRWTPHMEECLHILSETHDCPADVVLVLQVRIQLLLHRANQMGWSAGGIDSENNDSPMIPPAFFLKSVQSQLQQLKSGLSTEIQQNGKFKSITTL